MSADTTETSSVFKGADEKSIAQSKEKLDAHTAEIVAWHFHPSTGSPFWLEYAEKLTFDPLKEVNCFDDLKKFPAFEDEWLRGGPVTRWIPKGFAGQPAYVFETGGTTGTPMGDSTSVTRLQEISGVLPQISFADERQLTKVRVGK